MKQLFPKEIIEHTAQVHQFEHRPQSKAIYGVLLMAVIIALLSLPFIKISIYTTARGMLKPNKERIQVTTPYSGTITYVNIRDNQTVSIGDTLMLLNTDIMENKIQVSATLIQELETLITDASNLLERKELRSAHIVSPKYKKEYSLYLQKLQELQTRLRQTKRTYKRDQVLFEKGVIAKVALENSTFEYQLAKNAYRQQQKQQRTQWQTAITENKKLLLDLQSTRVQLQEEAQQLLVKATADGVLKNVQGIAIGSFVSAGTILAEISPDTALIAECYVTPADIGLITTKHPVNLQIDAFNYNQWGLATAQIQEISKAIDMHNNQPVFKVRCAVAEQHLELKNNFKGYLKKGMTFNARFQLTERTLFQLLYDQMDDWLNPANSNIAQQQN